MSNRALAAATIALIAGVFSVCSVGAIEDRFASDADLRRFVDGQHGEVLAIELGRLVYRKRWNEVLDESMYLIAPRGTWSETHPAWMPARQMLAQALREESARWLIATKLGLWSTSKACRG